MTVKVSIRELRNNLRAYLDRVKNGEQVVITERGQVMARITSASTRQLLDEMEAAGLLTRAKRPKTILGPKNLIHVRGSVSDIVIEQRHQSF